MNKYLITVPIIRKNYNQTSSSRFKGELSFVSNEYGVIYDWKINLTYVELDLLTTSSWFLNKNMNFKRREALFVKLNIKQKIRQNKSDNELLQLGIEQLKIINNYLNDRKDGYNSTIKNILPILKGNNPTGEASKPSSAELIINDSSDIKNFSILFDDLTMSKKVDFDSVSIDAQEISFKKFVSLNKSIENAFNFMQKKKNINDWLIYLDGIKNYYKKYNFTLNEADVIAKKARSKYSKFVKNVKPLPFGFSSNMYFQKCHIYEFWELRDKIVEAIRNKRSTHKYESMISDANNFIPLPEHIHRQFDRHIFTYKTNGDIYAINEEGFDFIKNIDKKYMKIPSFFLNDKRKDYLSIRNKNIIW